MDEKLKKFIQYFINVWLISKRGSQFNPTVWNHYGCIGYRTNNHLEGFHSQLKKDLADTKKPDIYTVIKHLRKVDAIQCNIYLRRKAYTNVEKARKQPKNNREKDLRIEKIQADFLIHRNFKDYFEALVHQVAIPYGENIEFENENDLDDSDDSDEQDIIKVKKTKLDANIFDNVYKNDNYFNDYFINNINKTSIPTSIPTSIQPATIQPVQPVFQPLYTFNDVQLLTIRGQITAYKSFTSMQHMDPRILEYLQKFLKNSQNLTNNISVLGPTKSTKQQKDIVIIKKGTKRKENKEEKVIKKKKLNDDIEITSIQTTTKYKGPILAATWKLNSTEWLSNGHKFLQLMEKNIYKVHYRGLFNPELYINFKSNTTQFNPDTIFDSPFVQILLADNHWVTVTNYNPFYTDITNDYSNKWFYFDSFNNPSQYIPSIKHAMKRLNTQSGSIQMVHCKVYPQHGSDDCGLFALAYVIALHEQKDPSKLFFEQISMRLNYNLCLESGKVTQFNYIEQQNTIVQYTEHTVDISKEKLNVSI